jgi:hypothetical protein
VVAAVVAVAEPVEASLSKPTCRSLSISFLDSVNLLHNTCPLVAAVVAVAAVAERSRSQRSRTKSKRTLNNEQLTMNN